MLTTVGYFTSARNKINYYYYYKGSQKSFDTQRSFDPTVSSLDEAETFDVSKILSTDDIPVTPNAIPASGDLNQFTHLRGQNFLQVYGATVTLLIGADVTQVFCMRSVRKGARGQPVEVE